MRLKNKVACITWGSSGIGKAIALLFASEWADIIITYHQHKKEAESLEKEINNFGRKYLALCYNAEKDNFQDFIWKIKENFSKIDILVNNAWIIIPKVYEELSLDIWEKTLQVNLTWAYNCTKAITPFMIAQKNGKIINISSISWIVWSLTSLPYAVSKAWIDAMTKNLAKELGKYNITANSIAPWPVKTDFLKSYSEEMIKKLEQETPLGRIAETSDIAKVALFFASSDSDFINGQTLIVDGGRIMR
jgi:3-oxoacyl-[acyl-carrier protein] reductase